MLQGWDILERLFIQLLTTAQCDRLERSEPRARSLVRSHESLKAPLLPLTHSDLAREFELLSESINFKDFMAARGHVPPAYEGRVIQAPGMMRHGPILGIGASAVRRPLEPLPPPELEHKLSVQAVELDRLARENQRLAATHVALRQDLVATKKETHRLQAHIGTIHTETDIQIRGLMEKIGKMEADIRAGEMLKKELQQAHLEAKSLVTARQELTGEIQQTTEELHKVNADVKKTPEMHAELDGLRQEHQKLRAAFEYEKNSNIEQVEHMRTREKNLISMAREVEKLRAEVSNAENRGYAPNPYGGTYGSQDPAYPTAGSGSSYPNHSYGQVGGYGEGVYGHSAVYSNGGYGQVGPANYSDSYAAYANPPIPISGGGGAVQTLQTYGGAVGVSYTDAYGRPQVLTTNGTVAGVGTNPYGAAGSVGTYDAVGGVPSSAQR